MMFEQDDFLRPHVPPEAAFPPPPIAVVRPNTAGPTDLGAAADQILASAKRSFAAMKQAEIQQSGPTPWQRDLATMTGYELEIYGMALGIERQASEADADFRERLAGARRFRNPPLGAPRARRVRVAALGVLNAAPAVATDVAPPVVDTRVPFPAIDLGGPPMSRREVVALSANLSNP